MGQRRVVVHWHHVRWRDGDPVRRQALSRPTTIVCPAVDCCCCKQEHRSTVPTVCRWCVCGRARDCGRFCVHVSPCMRFTQFSGVCGVGPRLPLPPHTELSPILAPWRRPLGTSNQIGVAHELRVMKCSVGRPLSALYSPCLPSGFRSWADREPNFDLFLRRFLSISWLGASADSRFVACPLE